MADLFKVEASAITENFSMKTCDRWDSLKHMQLVASLEENFEIEHFSLDEIVAMITYPALLDIMAQKTNGQMNS